MGRCACCNVVITNYAKEPDAPEVDLCPVCLGEVYRALDDDNPLVEPEYPKALHFPEKWYERDS